MTKRSKIEAKCVVYFHEFMESATEDDVVLLNRMLKRFAKEPVGFEELVRYEARRRFAEQLNARIPKKTATPESSDTLQYRLISEEPNGGWVEDIELTQAEFQELKNHLALIRSLVTA